MSYLPEFDKVETFFGIFTAIALSAQMYKILTTRSAQDFSIIFIFGIIIKNIILFIVGFINNLKGIMLSTFLLTLYNLPIVYMYYYGKK